MTDEVPKILFTANVFPFKGSAFCLFLETLFINSYGAAPASGYFRTLFILTGWGASFLMLVGEPGSEFIYGYCPSEDEYPPFEVEVKATPVL